MNARWSNVETENLRVIVLLVYHLRLRPIREFHIVVRALQPYKWLSMHMRHSIWASGGGFRCGGERVSAS